VLSEALAGAPAISDKSERPGLHELSLDVIAEQMKEGKKRLNIYKTLRGDYSFNFLPDRPKEADKPHLLLVETYRLSSFLGSYGVGCTIQTFSLLPGEKTKINIKTFRKTSADEKSASSILDSFSKESADDFESLLIGSLGLADVRKPLAYAVLRSPLFAGVSRIYCKITVESL
jgi:hypothetical protein